MTRRMKGLLLFSVVCFMLSSAWNVSTRIGTQKQTSASIDNIIEAIVIACEEDEGLRDQYKIRGEDVVTLAEVDKLQTTGAINLLSESEARRRFQSLLPKVKKIVNNVEILPVPDCEVRGEHLEQDLPAG